MCDIALQQSLHPMPNGCASLNSLPRLASAVIAHTTNLLREGGKVLTTMTTPNARSDIIYRESSPVLELQLDQPLVFPLERVKVNVQALGPSSPPPKVALIVPLIYPVLQVPRRLWPVYVWRLQRARRAPVVPFLRSFPGRPSMSSSGASYAAPLCGWTWSSISGQVLSRRAQKGRNIG